ncbi:hypothetical protein N9023_00555 [Opitutaceae bacterium]|nr:hypothetical protein [Opitutaceae bacterium]MDB4473469.1 hypothetical protein [Opitutaceae bacterium]
MNPSSLPGSTPTKSGVKPDPHQPTVWNLGTTWVGLYARQLQTAGTA